MPPVNSSVSSSDPSSSGDLEVETTEEAAESSRSGTAAGAIVGGTGAYKGASGELDVDWKNDSYTLHLLIPEE